MARHWWIANSTTVFQADSGGTYTCPKGQAYLKTGDWLHNYTKLRAWTRVSGEWRGGYILSNMGADAYGLIWSSCGFYYTEISAKHTDSSGRTYLARITHLPKYNPVNYGCKWMPLPEVFLMSTRGAPVLYNADGTKYRTFSGYNGVLFGKSHGFALDTDTLPRVDLVRCWGVASHNNGSSVHYYETLVNL